MIQPKMKSFSLNDSFTSLSKSKKLSVQLGRENQEPGSFYNFIVEWVLAWKVLIKPLKVFR